MDREQFITLSPEKRVEEVNKLLQKHTLKEIADLLEDSYSTFTTEIRNGGEYKYSKRNKRYVTVLSLVEDNQEELNEQSLAFINQHKDILQRLIDMYKSNNLLQLDEQVYSRNTTFENKSIKMNKEIYRNFSEFCDEEYPHLKMQDLIAQAILDFMVKYAR